MLVPTMILRRWVVKDERLDCTHTSIVVRVQADDDLFTLRDMTTKVLNLQYKFQSTAVIIKMRETH